MRPWSFCAISVGQIEAARAIGMSGLQQALYVMLPIAGFNTIPAMTSRYITLLKNTSLAFLIGLAEVTEIGREINNRLLTAPVRSMRHCSPFISCSTARCPPACACSRIAAASTACSASSRGDVWAIRTGPAALKTYPE